MKILILIDLGRNLLESYHIVLIFYGFLFSCFIVETAFYSNGRRVKNLTSF